MAIDGLYNQGKIKSITIAYYREDEIEKYKELLKHRNIYKITNFIEAKKIFWWRKSGQMFAFCLWIESVCSKSGWSVEVYQ